MNQILQIIKNDFKNFKKYYILQIVLTLSFLFAAISAFFPQIDPSLFVYITVFIIPVITFSISIFIEHEEKTLLPLALCDCPSIALILGKVLSSLILLLFPFLLYTLVMVFVLNMTYNILLFLLVYILSAIMHIIVGITLAIISKSTQIMSMSYIGYIVIFSIMPIFYQEGLIPEFFQYVLIVSPAYLSGVLFQEVVYGYVFSPNWLLVLAVVLQLAYIGLLSYFVVMPYFKSYLLMSVNKEEK
jgi:hypothetical protein